MFRYILVAMTLTDHAYDLLRDTEAKLRVLVSEAASSGDYASVMQITAWARTLSELVNKNSAKSKTSMPMDSASGERTRGQA